MLGPSPSFADLGLRPVVIHALRKMGVESPFPIQAATITDAIAGRDVLGRAPTGSGKTSLAYLLPRYHMATEGEVFIDGVDVRDIKIESLRSQITYVFQETQLFSLSIFDNICFGKPEASQAEVEKVAKIAGIHDFIISLPEGYETKLGSTAISKLSVGQKQRIAIARGLLRDSKILILVFFTN